MGGTVENPAEHIHTIPDAIQYLPIFLFAIRAMANKQELNVKYPIQESNAQINNLDAPVGTLGITLAEEEDFKELCPTQRSMTRKWGLEQALRELRDVVSRKRQNVEEDILDNIQTMVKVSERMRNFLETDTTTIAEKGKEAKSVYLQGLAASTVVKKLEKLARKKTKETHKARRVSKMELRKRIKEKI
ncbi:hypothetical protein ACROYT_G014846 [Oculina patagonica]